MPRRETNRDFWGWVDVFLVLGSQRRHVRRGRARLRSMSDDEACVELEHLYAGRVRRIEVCLPLDFLDGLQEVRGAR